jgi:regulator of protease activity HflC (stomatin/prohibitin superfamily)
MRRTDEIVPVDFARWLTLLGLEIILGVAVVMGLIGSPRFRIVRQFERGVVYRWGKVLGEPREAGITVLRPFADRLVRVNTQIITMPVPSQEGITKDNVTVRVDAVVYYRVMDPVKAIIEVQDYQFAVSQVAQTSLRSIIGKSSLDDLLSNREPMNQGLALMLDSPAIGWGIHIDRVEIKDVTLPESMKRSMARQAEADRERRARIITADGELQASKKLAQAADVMSASPAALQLRLLQTMVEVASEKSSTVILPFPVELLRFLEHSSLPHSDTAAANRRSNQTSSDERVAGRDADRATELALDDLDAAIAITEAAVKPALETLNRAKAKAAEAVAAVAALEAAADLESVADLEPVPDLKLAASEEPVEDPETAELAN